MLSWDVNERVVGAPMVKRLWRSCNVCLSCMNWQTLSLSSGFKQWRSGMVSTSIGPLLGRGGCLRGLWSSISWPPILGSFNLETAMECGEFPSLPLSTLFSFLFNFLIFFMVMALWVSLSIVITLWRRGMCCGHMSSQDWLGGPWFWRNFSVSHAFWGATFLNLWRFHSPCPSRSSCASYDKGWPCQ